MRWRTAMSVSWKGFWLMAVRSKGAEAMLAFRVSTLSDSLDVDLP